MFAESLFFLLKFYPSRYLHAQRCELCSKLTIKTPQRRHWRRSGVYIVNFEYISPPCPSVSYVNFEHVIAG